MRNNSLWAALALLLLVIPALAKDKHAPLPQKLLDAKSIYIDNQSGYADVSDGAYSKLSDWGRFKLLPSRDGADLVFLFTSAQVDDGRVHGTAVNLNNGTSIVNARKVTSCQIRLSIVDPKAPETSVWVNTKSCSRKGATTDLMNDLRKRFDSK